jgi:hypothetical protein
MNTTPHIGRCEAVSPARHLKTCVAAPVKPSPSAPFSFERGAHKTSVRDLDIEFDLLTDEFRVRGSTHVLDPDLPRHPNTVDLFETRYIGQQCFARGGRGLFRQIGKRHHNLCGAKCHPERMRIRRAPRRRIAGLRRSRVSETR